MRSLRLWGVRLGTAVLAFSASAFSADFTLSGTVYGTDNKPLPGVVVKLAQAGLSMTTDASGTWSLGSTAGIGKVRAVAVGSGRLQVEGGRISIRFSGHDLLGRGQGAQIKTLGQSVRAARSALTQDTLQYSWLGKVRLRDTVSVTQAGIVRKLDTNINAGIVHGYLTDERDGQTYRTVKIGPQVWMAQNLNVKVDSSWWYNDSAENGAKYGRLYQWATAMGLSDTCNTKSCSSQVTAKHRGVCPMGWHVPSDTEWTILTRTTLTWGTSGTKLKANSNLWTKNTGADVYGFSVLPAGYRYEGSFATLSLSANLWSASEGESTSAWYQNFYDPNDYASRSSYGNNKSSAFSLRCLQD